MTAVVLAAIICIGTPTGGIGEPIEVINQELPDTATFTIRGVATWLCDPPKWPRCTRGYPESSMVAAAGAELLPYRGQWVEVRRVNSRRKTTVRLVDACGCGGDRVIDLYAVAFRELADQGDGEVNVIVTVLGKRSGIVVPPTDTEGS